MPIAKTLFDATRQVPMKGERGWAGEGTKLWTDTCDSLDGSLKKVGNYFIPYYSKTNSTCSSGGTITQISHIHKVIGNSAPVVLSASISIDDGSKDGIILIIEGRSDTNTVTIKDNSNTKMNGDIVLGLGDTIFFYWDDTNSYWKEISRSN